MEILRFISFATSLGSLIYSIWLQNQGRYEEVPYWMGLAILNQTYTQG